ncbi:MAG: hypothetical protein JWQ74_1641 [Marmoricola sp.]|nr:hypothetical protein [Marmoricola sp.]
MISRTRLPVVPVSIGLVLVLRAVQFRNGGSPDEGGFLVVAGQWHSGSSLYGDYWVDRPPLLITLFRLADLLGGVPALRVLGALAAASTVALLASSARRAFGPRAVAWTALTAALLLATPLFRATDVNGELLALPFIALGIRAAIEAVATTSVVRSRYAALLAGAAAVGALMVKQNMTDVAVFAAVAWIVSWRSGRLTGGLTARRLLELVGAAAVGAVACYAAVTGWAVLHGTSPYDVYDATYPFRVKAAHVLAADPADTHRQFWVLMRSFALTCTPFLAGAFLLRGLRNSANRAVAWATLALLGWAVTSILVGGSYWLHYLIQAVPALALGAGAVGMAARRTAVVVTSLVATSALIAVGVGTAFPSLQRGTVIGEAVGRSAHPGDTLSALFGDAEIQRSSGMQSPYEYLWMLPAKTLDPDLRELDQVLRGAEAPTWIVARRGESQDLLEQHGVASTIAARYREVAEFCGSAIYLRRGTERPTPANTTSCSG